jgi:transcriptional regulator with XRE-family HTH domain
MRYNAPSVKYWAAEPSLFHVKHPPNTDSLGTRLRAAMRQANIGREELAKAAGVYPTTISKWLSDKNIPDSGPLDRAATRLGVTSNWLRYGGNSHEVGGAAAGHQLATAGVDMPTAVREAAARYGDILVRVPSVVTLPEDLPSAVRASIRRFEAELTEKGAAEYEIEFVRRILTAPEQLAYFVAGAAAHEDREAALLRGLRALMEGLRIWFREQHPESR